MRIGTFHFGILFHDRAFVSIDFNDGIYTEKSLNVEKATMHWNKSEAFTFELFKLHWSDGVNISFKEVNFNDHRDGYHQFLHDAITGWHAISPRGVSSGETLPFPINLSADILKLNFYDTEIHRTLSCTSQKMKKILEDSYVRDFLLKY